MASVEAAFENRPEGAPILPLPEPLAIEVLALNSLVIDLVKVMEVIAPGALDQTLANTRLRLQMLERGAAEVVGGEHLATAQKICILEHALGRTPTVMV